MKCLCIKTDPLQTLEVGKEYDYYKRNNKVHIHGRFPVREDRGEDLRLQRVAEAAGQRL